MMNNVLIILAVGFFLVTDTQSTFNDKQLKEFLQNVYEKEATQLQTKANFAEWNYETDLGNKTKGELTVNATLEAAEFNKETWNKYFRDLKETDFTDNALKRQVKFLRILGEAILSPEKLKNLTETKKKLETIYSVAKICPYKKQNCNIKKEGWSLDPEIDERMKTSRDYDELSYIWTSWHEASGGKMRELYKTYVELNNEQSRLNSFTDYGDSWRYSFESPNFIADIDTLWLQIAPFYNDLHTYTLNKLHNLYGDQLSAKDGLIPAHLLGNMWAQEWTALYDILEPYPNVSTAPDVTEQMKQQNFTVLKMFEVADEFYQSMGLLPNGICYDVSKGAMIEKPKDRDVVCHASAWDFSDGENYRVKMCTKVNVDDFITVHHEMGHIEYFLQYANQSVIFRGGANPGFHEAIGDTIALSVATPKHLQRIGLAGEYKETKEGDINALMKVALSKVAFLPFGLLVDKWRWDVFSGVVNESHWNDHWNFYREKYQKVKPPVERVEKRSFDPGAKHHIPSDSQYISYFVAHILQFQFYKSLCLTANEYDPKNKTVPLYTCDFYQSKTAGKKFGDGLKLGSSKHWKDVLEIMTGERDLNAGPLLEYFEPLWSFLKEENLKSTL